MRRNVHPKIRIAAASFFLLLMFMLQAGKLFHASQHAFHDRSSAHPASAEKHHGANFTQTICSACEFEYCREALPEDIIDLPYADISVTARLIPRVVSVSLPLLFHTDWRGPPAA